MVKDAEHERILIMDEPRLRSISWMQKAFVHATCLVSKRKNEGNKHSFINYRKGWMTYIQKLLYNVKINKAIV